MIETKKQIGVVGLGIMGSQLSQCLVNGGYSVSGYDIVRAKMSEVSMFGVSCEESPKNLAAVSEIIILCLTNSVSVEEVVFGSDGIIMSMNRPKIIIDQSTTEMDKTRDMAARLKKLTDIGWVDAPISGGPDKAANGQLAIMVGGSYDNVFEASEVLSTLASNFTHFGPVGSGQLAKMVNQILVLNNFTVIAEALALAEAGGIDPGKIPSAFASGHAGSNLLTDLMPKMSERNFKPKGYARQIFKDLCMIKKIAQDLKISIPMSEKTTDLFRILNEQGDGGLDGASIIKLYDRNKEL